MSQVIVMIVVMRSLNILMRFFDLLNQRKYQFLVLVEAWKLEAYYFIAPDAALTTYIKQGLALPYGLLWLPINWPLYFSNGGLSLWALWLIVADIPVTYFLWRKLDMSSFIVAQTFILIGFGGDVNVSTYWLAGLGIWNPAFTVLSVVSKLPLGYWPVVGNPHWNDAFGQGLQSWRFHTLNRDVSYGLLLVAWINSFRVWWRRRRRIA